MANEDAHPLESRTPTLEDLVTLCRSLNECAAKYLIVGGFAVIQHGYLRTTGDIDVLVEDSLENQARVKKALEVLPDQAIRQLGEEDLRDWVVVRVADEVVVDLLTKACGINYTEAQSEIQFFTISGVVIPFALRCDQAIQRTHSRFGQSGGGGGHSPERADVDQDSWIPGLTPTRRGDLSRDESWRRPLPFHLQRRYPDLRVAGFRAACRCHEPCLP
jgi:hypothetical protein